jgi:hypothetical protein
LRRLWPLLAMVAARGGAQSPDVVLKVDLNPFLQVDDKGRNTFRWYDSLGHHSTVGLSMILEPGYRLVVTERIQRMPADSEQLDEYYVEDEGNWRLGKQYLPFGREFLIRESVQAIRADTNLIVEGLPIVIAGCDGGDTRQRGIVGRIGTRIGVSFALGRHFGIEGTSLAVVRDPDSAPGSGRGYKAIFGLDVGKRLNRWRLAAEVVALRQGETVLDEEREVSDLSFTLQETKDRSFTFGWSRDWKESENVFRFQGRTLLTRSVWLEPILRFAGTGFKDVGVAVRIKL